jgi:hypothetical protein
MISKPWNEEEEEKGMDAKRNLETKTFFPAALFLQETSPFSRVDDSPVGSYWRTAQKDVISFAFYNIIVIEFHHKLISYVGNNVKRIVLGLHILLHPKYIRREMDSKAYIFLCGYSKFAMLLVHQRNLQCNIQIVQYCAIFKWIILNKEKWD